MNGHTSIFVSGLSLIPCLGPESVMKGIWGSETCGVLPCGLGGMQKLLLPLIMV